MNTNAAFGSRRLAVASVWLAAASVWLSGLSGCATPLDANRDSVDTGSFGNTVMTLICKRMAYLNDLEDGDGTVDVRGEQYREICREGGIPPADAPDDLKAFQAKRPLLVEAVDTMWPEDFLDQVQLYATSTAFLSAYDDGTILGGVDAAQEILKLAAPRDEVTAAVARLAGRTGYTPASSGALSSLLSYPQLSDVLQNTVVDVAPGGIAYDAMVAMAAGGAIELRNLEAADPETPEDPDSTPLLALNLLFTERDELSTENPVMLVERDRRGIAVINEVEPGVLVAPYVDSDGDGLADVDDQGRYIDAAGAAITSVTPFAVAGDDPAAGRDEQGRLLDNSSGVPVFRYRDLDKSLLGALARDAAPLMNPDNGTGIDLLRGIGAIMGPRQMTSRAYDNGETLAYQGFDSAQSAVLDLIYGGLQLLQDDRIGDVLALGRTLLSDHEVALAQLSDALVDVLHVSGDLGEVGERAALAGDSALWDDLIPVVKELLEVDGLFADLMKATEDPRLKELGPELRNFMTYTDEMGYDANQNLIDLSSGQIASEFVKPVDRSQPDSGTNRSIFQRVLHLLADADGLPLCNKEGARVVLSDLDVGPYPECELLKIDNLAVFYLQSLAFVRGQQGDPDVDENGFLLKDPDSGGGFCDNRDTETHSLTGQPVRKGKMPFNFLHDFDGDGDPDFETQILANAANDSTIEIAGDIKGLTNCPTPQALNRILFLSPRPEFLATVIDPPQNRHGQLFEEVHRGSLPGWELGKFFELMQPLVQPFADHDQEELLVKILVILYKHWPSPESSDYQQDNPDGPSFTEASNVVSYEPILAEIFHRGHLLSALVDTSPTLNQLVVNERPVADILRETALKVITPKDGLAKRNGDTTTTTPDGRPVETLSLWHILADGYRSYLALLAGVDEPVAAAWDRALLQALDIFARGQAPDPEVPDSTWRFQNPRLRGVGLTLIDFLEARIQAHDDVGDRALWLAVDLPAELEDLLAGPLVVGAIDLVEALSNNPDSRKAVEGMLAYALDEARDPQAFAAILAATGDVLQLLVRDEADLVPVGHLLGDVLNPDRGWLDPLLNAGRATGQADTNGVLAQTLRNLVTSYHPDRTPLSDLADGIGEVFRVQPFQDLDATYTAADYRAVLNGLAEFLEQEKRGLRTFIDIIANRNRSQ